jgi:hypothetical protein
MISRGDDEMATAPARVRRSIMTKFTHGILGTLSLVLSILATAAFAEPQPTAAQRAACIGDAMKLCTSQLTSVMRVYNCLLSNRSQLSPRCRAEVDAASKTAQKK